MSEIQKNPETNPAPKPIFDDCSGCDQRYQLTAMTANGVIYPKQPECSYLMCRCPNCGYKTQIFCNETTIEMAALNGIDIEGDEMYAPDDIYKSWLEVKGIELVETYQLTARHEKLIGQFATSLANTPDEYLYDLITDDGYGRPHPLRWV